MSDIAASRVGDFCFITVGGGVQVQDMDRFNPWRTPHVFATVAAARDWAYAAIDFKEGRSMSLRRPFEFDDMIAIRKRIADAHDAINVASLAFYNADTNLAKAEAGARLDEAQNELQAACDARRAARA